MLYLKIKRRLQISTVSFSTAVFFKFRLWGNLTLNKNTLLEQSFIFSTNIIDRAAFD